MLKTVEIFFSDLRVLFKKFHCQKKHIVKIDCVVIIQRIFVFFVYFGNILGFEISCKCGKSVGILHFVFCIGNYGFHKFWLINFIVKIKLFDGFFYNRIAVGFVINRKVFIKPFAGLETVILNMLAEHSSANSVKSSDPHIFYGIFS